MDKQTTIEVLNLALSTGADYAEIYQEKVAGETIVLENGKVDNVHSSQRGGLGLRLLKGTQTAYAYTSDLSRKNLLKLASSLAGSFQGEPLFQVKSIKRVHVPSLFPIPDPVLKVPLPERIDYLKSCYEATASVDPRLARIIDSLSSGEKNIRIVIAEGEEAKEYLDHSSRSRVAFSVVALDGTHMESSYLGSGEPRGWSYFTKELDVEEKAKSVGRKAIRLLNAAPCPNGRFPVVIAHGWGGVLFHEACGHSLEADATSKGQSVFSNSLGKQIASPIVSAVDDGSIPSEWGSSNIDSEGVKTRKNQLIKDGICVGFLVDRLSGRRLHMEPNGCSRRANYRYIPTSRMSNTYIEPGKDSPEDIIKDTPYGIYVADFNGGSVEPTTGEFNFAASEAYMIRDGKIAEPIKGCTLIGTGQEVLMNIDRVGNDLMLGNGGYCGAASGDVPVDVGQPTIRISSLTVGGMGGKGDE